VKISQSISVSSEPRVRVSDGVCGSVALRVIGLSWAVPDAFEEQYGCCYANKGRYPDFLLFPMGVTLNGSRWDTCRCLSAQARTTSMFAVNGGTEVVGSAR